MIWELTALAGLALATVGLYLIHPPYAWLGLGVVLVWIGIRGSRYDSSR